MGRIKVKCPNWLSLAFINLSTQLWLIQTWFELTNPHFCSKYSLSIWNSTVLDLVGNVSLVLSWCFILPYSSALLSNLTVINPSHLISLSNLAVLPSLSPRCFPLSSPRLSHISTISVLGPKGAFPFELASFPPPCQPLFWFKQPEPPACRGQQGCPWKWGVAAGETSACNNCSPQHCVQLLLLT